MLTTGRALANQFGLSLVLLVFSISSANAGSRQPAPDSELTCRYDRGSVCGIGVGTPIKDALRQAATLGSVKRRIVDMGEGETGEVFHVLRNGKVWFEISPDERKVSGIMIFVPNIRSKEGVGVGSTFAELKNTFGKMESDYSEAPGVSSCAWREGAGFTFCFKTAKPKDKSRVKIVSVFGKM
jgi:hypothetical protein